MDRSTATWLGLAGCYAALPLAFIGLWLLDLWAKSYDFPIAQLRARIGLALVAALVSAWFAYVAAGVAVCPASRLVRYAMWGALVPSVAAWVWTLGDLNSRGAYVASATGIGAVALLGGPLPRSAMASVGSMVLLVAGVAAVNEHPRYRLARYARALHACACCGYKQRAVHELCALGPAGESLVRGYLTQGAPWDSAVREEWERCRPAKR